MIRPLSALLVALLPLALPAQHLRYYSPGQAGTILTDFHEAVVTYHPAAFIDDNRAALDSALAYVQRDLSARAPTDSLPMAAVIAAAAPFREILRDGHFQLRPVQTPAFTAAQRTHQYDLPLTRDGDGNLLLRDTAYARDSTVLPKGALVIDLDGHEVQTLLSEVSALGGVDDHAYRYAREFYPAHALPEFYQRVYGYRDSLRLTTLQGGDTTAVWLSPKPVAPADSAARKRPVRVLLTRGRRKRDALAERVYVDTTDVPGVYHLNMPSFSRGVLGGANPYRRVRRLFRDLEAADATGLVIDVRNNLGGSADLVDHLFGYLAREPYTMLDTMIAFHRRALGRNAVARLGTRVFGRTRGRDGHYRRTWAGKPVKPKRRHRFDGEVVVLVNELTFSGGSTLAHYVQHYGRGRVVGQVAGGSAERMYAGDSFEIKLGPEDELRITMPLWYMDMVGDARGNLTPDLIVERTPEVLLDDEDDTLRAALDLLQTE